MTDGKINQTQAREIGIGAQVEAANPTSSVWVGANAGTGKTHVLTERITRLLLDGAVPGRILCLTFTKAAAAEMATRLSDRLGQWTSADDDKLRADLKKLLGRDFDGDLAQARRLFASCLEFPGGLKIQTIHAFCQSLLARFPMEAGLAPNQRVMDDRTSEELLREARDRVLNRTLDQSHLRQASNLLATLVDEETFQKVMRDLTGKRAQLEKLYRVHRTTAKIGEAMRSRLGLSVGLTEADIHAEAANCDEAALKSALDVLLGGPITDQRAGNQLADWLASPDDRINRFDDYGLIFMTSGLKGPRKNVITKKRGEAHPDALETLQAEQQRIMALVEKRRCLQMAEATEALLVMGKGLLDAYCDLKQQRGLLDYDDLILTALNLLKAEGGANWVLYKLDGGLDHILVDEAQDTSAEQWAIVELLAAEFFTGLGQADPEKPRTLFVVGDEKQSIYSFQGADPEGFGRMRRLFQKQLKDSGDILREVELALSFRSTWAIVQAVDAVFATELARTGLTSTDRPIRHLSNRNNQAGLVELWEPALPDLVEEDVPWDAPMDRISVKSPEAKVADRIADTIKHWIDNQVELPSRARPIAAGDILILMQKRGQFAARMVRALKDRGIPVSGTDRMNLLDQLVVQDLMAAASFALLPDDDLNLAALLKSPLIGLNEDQLFMAAHDRGKASLWQALQSRVDQDKSFGPAIQRLKLMLGRADTMPPFEFFEQLLVVDQGRSALLSWLGPDAEDPIDEFLSMALNFEREHAPSLQGFLHWLQAGSAVIKRDLEQGQGQVRVMTVHGSKGLQGDIVFLADACRVPDARQKDPLLWDHGDPESPCVFWPVVKENEVGRAGDLRAQSDQMTDREYRRLLYVAMTRARDQLYVTGWQNTDEITPHSWYGLISKALADNMLRDVETQTGPARRLEMPQTGAPDGAGGLATVAAGQVALPDWINQSAPVEPVPSQPLSPSKPDAEPAGQSPLDRDDPLRFKRGQLIHRLLQSLPELADNDRVDAGLRMLLGHGVVENDAKAWLGETLNVLRHPDYAPLFGPGSLAEVPIIGTLDDQVVSAQIDRLVVLADKIMIVDFKTNRPPPEDPSGIPDVYIRQMQGYRRLIESLYPGKPVEDYLLWTDGPRLMALPR